MCLRIAPRESSAAGPHPAARDPAATAQRVQATRVGEPVLFVDLAAVRRSRRAGESVQFSSDFSGGHTPYTEGGRCGVLGARARRFGVSLWRFRCSRMGSHPAPRHTCTKHEHGARSTSHRRLRPSASLQVAAWLNESEKVSGEQSKARKGLKKTAKQPAKEDEDGPPQGSRPGAATRKDESGPSPNRRALDRPAAATA